MVLNIYNVVKGYTVGCTTPKGAMLDALLRFFGSHILDLTISRE